MHGPLSDERALRRIRRDPEAICVLYDRHAARLVAELNRRTGDREVAVELMQETIRARVSRGLRAMRLRLSGVKF
jgi:hypothetical protein